MTDPVARELLSTTDAVVWARRFAETVRAAAADGRDLLADEGFLIGWFANAIEIGRGAISAPILGRLATGQAGRDTIAAVLRQLLAELDAADQEALAQ